ncbi:MAG: homoprotocatechuate degradation operon regulator HpaR, partial [Acidobacteriota bacterium]|nr:homoprotocatechuate degradation operon regulator HpaR [Acidobacteriota bacterium]
MSQALRDFSRSLPMALLRAREAVMERFRPLLRRHGVTEQQWRVLRALESAPETSASSLAATTCIGLPSLSRILASLEGRGLIARRVKATDLRTTLVSLSPAGARLLRRAGAESEARYESLSRQIGEANMHRLYALLDRVAAARDGRPPGIRVTRGDEKAAAVRTRRARTARGSTDRRR